MRDLSKLSTGERGNLGEAKVMAAFLNEGVTISVPWGNVAYDLVAERGNKLFRVQCKLAREARAGSNSLIWNTYSVVNGVKRHYADEDEIDLYGLYSPKFDDVAIIPVENVARSCGTLSSPRWMRYTVKLWANGFEGYEV